MSGTRVRRSSWARWGWLGVVVSVVMVLANAALLVLGVGGPLNLLAVVVCSASGVFAFSEWRDEVHRERRWVR